MGMPDKKFTDTYAMAASGGGKAQLHPLMRGTMTKAIIILKPTKGKSKKLVVPIKEEGVKTLQRLYVAVGALKELVAEGTIDIELE